ncbi:OB-fold putative lipoprotein [Burkholderia thailandensis]|uniref:OB-fold putative lipoprotein n=1 Tax=Burkholderia thailandensis TaxID=57975 RepID=UPI001E53F97F|nr:OB-fold putative lipoprotein [Burkholderia thailandensis]MCZ2896360.1 OB-fold putative lipoprotein [Burkholderia thailandensis]
MIAIGALVGGNDQKGASPANTSASSETSHVTKKAAEPALSVTASQLFAAYEKNEVAADQQYKGKSLLVSGTVQSIDKDAFDNIVIQLRTSNEFMPVHAYLASGNEAVAASLDKGQKVKWVCEGEGRLIGSPMLRECVPNA